MVGTSNQSVPDMAIDNIMAPILMFFSQRSPTGMTIDDSLYIGYIIYCYYYIKLG